MTSDIQLPKLALYRDAENCTWYNLSLVNNYQSGVLWKYAQLVGDAQNGAVTHPGAKAETHMYADI